MFSLRQRALTICLLIAGLFLTGCSGNNRDKETPSATPTISTSTPPPHYTFEKVKASLLTERDLGSGWKPYSAPVGQRIENITSCFQAIIKLPGDAKTVIGRFGAPDRQFKGANYATHVSVFDDEKAATKGFELIRSKIAKCSSKHFSPSKTLSGNRRTYSHHDAWALTEDSVSGWTHLRGTETDTYSPDIGLLSVWHLMHDYALRGNVVFTSMYWQILEPKKPGKPVEKRASEILAKQLEKLG